MPNIRKLRFGMVGGGRGAFIGAVHRIAARMDGEAELVAGAFASDPQRSFESGKDLGVLPERAYGSYEEMAELESRLEKDQRLDWVSIVTPNHVHFGCAKAFLEAGFNVVCDKPATLTREEAEQLADLVRSTKKVFVLTHNYTGNPMVKQARTLARRGKLGFIRKVVVEYSQGWLAQALETTGQKQAAWRTDPKRSGAAGCMGDIGTHCENLARYITGLRIEALCADLTTFVPGRRLDDDGNVLLRFKGGAKGVLHCSQVAIGNDNNLRIAVYGEQASLAWRQEEPDELEFTRAGGPTEVLRRGNAYLADTTRAVTRLPGGHPEGYLEAFANIYREAFRAIRAEVAGDPLPADLDFPTIDDGVIGMRFIEAVVESSRQGAKWISL